MSTVVNTNVSKIEKDVMSLVYIVDILNSVIEKQEYNYSDFPEEELILLRDSVLKARKIAGNILQKCDDVVTNIEKILKEEAVNRSASESAASESSVSVSLAALSSS